MTTRTTAPAYRRQWRGYSLFHWILCVAALVFATIWILTFVFDGFSAPSWVGAAAVFSLALALWIP